MRSDGRPFGPVLASGEALSAQEKFIAELRRRGAKPDDLQRLAQSAHENLAGPDAVRQLGRDVERAAQRRHSDLFETPYDPNFKESD